MPTTATPPTADSLRDLTRLLQAAEGFRALADALRAGRSGSVDGAWGSSGALATAALGQHAPRAVLVAVAHPRDVDGWVSDLHTFSGERPAVFPAWDSSPGESGAADETATQRLRLLKQMGRGEAPRFVVTTMQALLQPVPDRERLNQGRKVLRAGEQVDPDELARWLVDHAYQRVDAVELPGEFSRRGGILDVYPPDAEAPYRLEFFGDEVESIRQFSPETQRSLGALERAEITAADVERSTQYSVLRTQPPPPAGHLCDYLPADAWTVLVEPDDLREQAKHYLERVSQGPGMFSVEGAFRQLLRFPSVTVTALPGATVEATCHLRVESVERFTGDVTRVREELDGVAAGDRVLIACHNEAEARRLGEVLAAGRLAQSGRLRLVVGRVRAGFRVVGAGVLVLADHELFRREEARHVLPRRRLESRAIDSFLDLSEGDLVVHVSHGIARFLGMQLLDKNGQSEEHLVLEFREGVRLFVPASKIDLVQKYVGGARAEPELSKLGGTSWQRRKEKVQAAVLDLAGEMIALQALRESRPGIAFPADTEWQAEFEAAFPYQETPDQLTTLAELKRDM